MIQRDTKSRILLHEDRPRYDWWLKLIIGGVLAFTLVLGLVYIPTEPEAAWILLGITVFDAMLFWAILPQRLLIYEDRLVLKLGGPFTVNVPFTDIKEARPTTARKVFMYWGNRFATSTTGVVEIVRYKSTNIMISPLDAEMFLRQINQARQ